MYGKKSWGGTADPVIEVSFQKTEQNSKLSFVIWEYEDTDNLGRLVDGNDVSSPLPPPSSFF